MPDKKASKIESKLDFWIQESVKDKPFEVAFDLEKEIGSGPFGIVYNCKAKGQKNELSVKVIPKNRDRRVYLKEASLLLKLSHQNLARIYEIFETVDHIYIVSEVLNGLSVLDRISKKSSFSERDAVEILKQILEGLKYVHDQELLHGNLKPENFLFDSEDENESHVKITDIAMYSLFDKEILKHSLTSSAQYCAPEILRNETGNQASDMWSIGAFAYLLLCGEEPFQAESEEALYTKVLKGSFNTESDNYARLSTNAKDFIIKLLRVDPKKRMTVYEALNNNWLLGKATKSESLTLSLDSMKIIANKKKTEAYLNKQVLRTKNGKISMTQKYLPKDVWIWLQKTTKYGTSLVDCVKSAVENPDSSVGLYAPDPDCYDTFPEIFFPVISDYHKVDAYSIKSVHDFGQPNELPDLDQKYSNHILSTRIRVGRTVKGYPMCPKLTRETREQVKNEMLRAFTNLSGDLYGDFKELAELSYEERDHLINSHYLFADADDRFLKSAGGYEDWPLNRGIFMNRNKTFVVWLNEEDHVRIISIQKGANVKQVYARLVKGLQTLEKSVEFVHHERFGYLTFCPTNIGTGLRASVLVKLPKLANSGKLKPLCESLNLQARGFHGEHSESEGGIFDISNKIRIGKTEFDLINTMISGIKKLIDAELAS